MEPGFSPIKVVKFTATLSCSELALVNENGRLQSHFLFLLSAEACKFLESDRHCFEKTRERPTRQGVAGCANNARTMLAIVTMYERNSAS